jgi:hypothetical protein
MHSVHSDVSASSSRKPYCNAVESKYERELPTKPGTGDHSSCMEIISLPRNWNLGHFFFSE